MALYYSRVGKCIGEWKSFYYWDDKILSSSGNPLKKYSQWKEATQLLTNSIHVCPFVWQRQKMMEQFDKTPTIELYTHKTVELAMRMSKKGVSSPPHSGVPSSSRKNSQAVFQLKPLVEVKRSPKWPKL